MKLALLLTGGTILSKKQSDFYTLSDSAEKEILSLIPSGIEAEVFSPYFILSEQLDGDYLTRLIDFVGDKLKQNYDGIVILHGTDTLQFSAAALSLAYGNADIPIVLVSSNYVLSDKRSNGRDNLRYALRFIEKKIGGVFVSYRNTDEKPSIFLGSSLLPHLPYSDRLYSTCGKYGYFDKDNFVNLVGEPSLDSIGKFTLTKDSPVLWIKASPGMKLTSSREYKAVLLEAYHSGTLPTENDSFINFCKDCNKPIYVTGVSKGTQYSSTKSFDNLGLKTLPEASPVFAYISLWQRYSE
ncbi:MAG: asparaginase [Ruminococcus sp.]|nr:asparaginase [Ruminococcus sp.]